MPQLFSLHNRHLQPGGCRAPPSARHAVVLHSSVPASGMHAACGRVACMPCWDACARYGQQQQHRLR